MSGFGGGPGPGCLLSFLGTACGVLLALLGSALTLFPALLFLGDLRTRVPAKPELLGLSLLGAALLAAGIALLRRCGGHRPW